MARAVKMGRHRGFMDPTMRDVEAVTIHSVVERLPGFTHILETTPPTLY